MDVVFFCQACDQRFTPPGEPGWSPSEKMLETADVIDPVEAKRLAQLPVIAWENEPVIRQIREAVNDARCSDRAIQAVLEAAAARNREADCAP